MLKKLIAYTVALLISVQTFAAAVDVHQSHQSGSEHIEFNHEHQASSEQSSFQKNDSQNQQTNNQSLGTAFDCHHCCHCHGGHFNFLSLSKSLSTPFTYHIKPAGYIDPAQSGIKTHPYRPPKV